VEKWVMRSNGKSKSTSEEAPEPPAEPATGVDDQSDPSKQHQMNAIWPLLWLLVPLASLILYGLFSGQ
jgi:hypothetical protein